MNIGVVGAGVAGCLTALELRRRGAHVTLWGASSLSGARTCSYAAGGMLSPVAEAVYGHASVGKMGWNAVALWSEIVASLKKPIGFGSYGSLVLADEGHLAEIEEWRQRLSVKFPGGSWRRIDKVATRSLEPNLQGSGLEGIWLESEGFIDSRAFMETIFETLEAEGVELCLGVWIDQVSPGFLRLRDQTHRYDVVIDCRGLKAKEDLLDLRGVRGEALILSTSEVSITRPVRFLHQRYPVYIVPRGGGFYYIGATVIESESVEPPCVKSILEILAGVYQFHPGFRYARVVELLAEARPAFFSNVPLIEHSVGLVRLNGLFRHGFLLSPMLSKTAADLVYRRDLDPGVLAWIRSLVPVEI